MDTSSAYDADGIVNRIPRSLCSNAKTSREESINITFKQITKLLVCEVEDDSMNYFSVRDYMTKSHLIKAIISYKNVFSSPFSSCLPVLYIRTCTSFKVEPIQPSFDNNGLGQILQWSSLQLDPSK